MREEYTKVYLLKQTS